MEQKILFEIRAQDRNLNALLEQARESQRRLLAELRKSKEGTDEFKRLSGEVGNAKQKVRELTDQQKRFNREAEGLKVSKDSLVGMRLEYSKLSRQIAELSAQERNSPFGKSLIKNAVTVKKGIDDIEQSIGRFTGNVGNYKTAFLGLGDVITGGLVTGGVIVGFQKLIEALRMGANEALKYEKALDDLSALTGVTGKALKDFQSIEQSLRQIEVNGVEIVNTGPEILNALKLVGGARPELLKDAAALGEVSKNAIILSQASGDELEPSVIALTTVLGQFDLRASESARVINELAAGAKAGASEIPQTTDALQKFGTVAKISNVSTAESIALVELLADRQLKGAEAGTQLRNVLSKLAAADILPREAQNQFSKLSIDVNILKNASLPLEARLKELGKAQGDLSALTKVFGLENLQAATIITSGIGKYGELKKAIEGTNEAYTQAAIRADNASTKLSNLGNKVLNSLGESFNDSTGVISRVTDFLGFLVDKVDAVGFAFDTVVGPINSAVKAFSRTKDFLGFGPEKVGTQIIDTLEPGFFKDTKTGTGDATDALLKEIDRTKILGEVVDKTGRSIAHMRKEVKALKVELANATPGSDEATQLAARLNIADEELKTAERLAGLRKSERTEAKAAAGSIKDLENQLSKINERITTAPQDVKILQPLIDEAARLEKQLAAAKAKLDNLRKPTAARFAPGASGSLAPSDSDIQGELGGGLGRDIFDSIGAQLGKELVVIEPQLDVEQAKAVAQQLDDIFKKGEADRNFEGKNKEIKKRKELNEQIKSAAIDSAQNISNAVFEIRRNGIEQELQSGLTALDRETNARIEAANGNEAKIEAIRADAAKKQEALEKAAAKRRKEIAIRETIINTALAIVKALPNLVLAGVAAVAGAAQLAVIRSQKFEKGGKVALFNGPSHAGGGITGTFSDGSKIEVEGDEAAFVLKKNDRRRIAALSRENVRRGGVPYFADGGRINFGRPAIPNAQQASSSALSVSLPDSEISRFAAIVASEVGRASEAATYRGVVDGQDTANRVAERQQTLKTNRAI